MKTYTKKTITYSENMMKELVKELKLGTRLMLDRELIEMEEVNKLTLEDLEMETVTGEVYTFDKLYSHKEGDITYLYYRLESNTNSTNNPIIIKETRTGDKPLTFEVACSKSNSPLN